MSRSQIKVVSTLPISTTNMTGFLITCCGTSLRKLSQTAGRTISGSNNERSFKPSVCHVSKPFLPEPQNVRR